jgi:hypothetical protein
LTLRPLPDAKETVIVVGTTVRKSLPVLRAHLASLDWQELPPRHRLHYCFVPDFPPGYEDAAEFLFRWVNERGGTLLQGVPSQADDFADTGATHQWAPSAMARVGANKNLILQHARATRADFLLLCDADLILDRTTVASLLSTEKPIATAVYWTRWQQGHGEPQPQVWLQHPYQLEGRGMDAAEFRGKLVNRELTRVWGFGACTLLNQRVLDAGISFAYLPGVPVEGMMAGEDRHFSIDCERRHIDAYADAWPDVFHIYHPEDHARIPEQLARLGEPHPRLAGIGDLVSLRLRPLEPLQVGPQRYQGLPVVLVRGRLGALPLAPALEDAVRALSRGQQQIVKVSMPSHHPFPQFRGRNRLIELTVIDVKPNTPHPTLDA